MHPNLRSNHLSSTGFLSSMETTEPSPAPHKICSYLLILTLVFEMSYFNLCFINMHLSCSLHLFSVIALCCEWYNAMMAPPLWSSRCSCKPSGSGFTLGYRMMHWDAILQMYAKEHHHPWDNEDETLPNQKQSHPCCRTQSATPHPNKKNSRPQKKMIR